MKDAAMNHQTNIQVDETASVLLRIDQLNESHRTDGQYFANLLSILVESLGAASGHIWHYFEDEFQPMIRSVSPFEDNPEWIEQERLLALHSYNDQQTSQKRASEFHFTDQDANVPAHLRRCCLLVPLRDHATCFGIVSLITYVQDSLETERQIAFLSAAAQRVQKQFLFQYFAESAGQIPILRRAQQITEGIGKYIEIKPLAFEVVSRLREYMDCDRVSLAFKSGNRCVLKGVSNQAVFDRRANVVRRQEALASQVARIEEPLWYPDDQSDLAPSLRGMLDRYFEASHALSIALLPLFGEPKRRDDPEDIAATIRSDDERRECVGVLILEGLQAPLAQETILRRWERVETSVSNSIANARKHDSLFLMPVWRTLGIVADLYRGHTRRKALMITGLVAAILALLIVVPGDFKIRGEGDIRPTKQQHLYAETDGTIEALLFQDGQAVAKGDLLILMENPKLATQIADVEGKLREAEKKLETITVQRVTRSFENEQEERELVRTAASEEARVTGLQEQFSLLKKSEAQLRVESPMSGEVVTWDTQQRLQSRPVKRGDRLITIALPSGGWEVELRIPDKRAGYLLRQWHQSQRQSRSMNVSFVLASNPTEVLRGTVFEVSPKSNIDDQNRENVIRIRTKISDQEFVKIQGVKPGTTVIGHVHCGRASIGYCKLYEFFDWTRRMWFKFVS